MDPHLTTLQELSCWRARPEPHMPPGLNREQAWAWALDNFPALSRRSCQHPQFCMDGSYCACGSLRRACTGPGAGPPLERGHKRCQDPGVQTETAVELQSPPQEADATDSAAHWGLKQPGDARASGGGQTHGQLAARSPGRPRKLLKTGP